ncbi:ligand-gated channel protein [Salinicola aestuarinus]|uniref:ligand-gated channel protein n=1 Tax=Salinicola aestuarinus TaxID=1949082 RepID=UPI000DA1108A|nr:ligand-gated channel protein [Salinicola aestuarinus]
MASKVSYAAAGALSLIVSQPVLAQATTADTMVVTAAGYAQQVTNAPASISVITREELEDKYYRDVTDALQNVPGVMITGGGSSQDISLRGMASKYTLILIDGKRQGSRETRPNSDGPGIEQGWLPPLSAIERIEVIRGPMSSLYGSDALGGVINIITRKVPQAWSGSVTADTTLQEDADSGNINQSRFYVGGPLSEERLGLQLYGQYSHRDEDHIENGYNEQRLGNATAKLSWQVNDANDLTFEAGYDEQTRISNPGESVAEVGRRGPASRSNTHYRQHHYAVTHSARVAGSTIDSYVQREETDNPSRDMTYQSTVFNTKAVVPLGMHILTVGADYEDQALDDGGNQAGAQSELTRWRGAVFVEDEWMLTNDFSLTGGARLNRDENYGNHWSPRLYGVWNATEAWTVKGGVTSGYRAPDLRQSTPGWGQVTGGPNAAVPAVILGNADLDPEKSLNQELGVIWSGAAGVQAGVTLFHTQFEDKITEQRVCDTEAGDASCSYGGTDYRYISRRFNVDEVTTQGVEATLTLPLGDDYSLSANYTYTDSEQKTGEFKGEPLNRLPEHMANATLDWEPGGALSGWARVNYRGRTTEGLSRTSMTEELPSYTFVDTGVAYGLNEHVKLFGGIYNLFDKDVGFDDYEKVLDGRRYNAGVTVSF